MTRVKLSILLFSVTLLSTTNIMAQSGGKQAATKQLEMMLSQPCHDSGFTQCAGIKKSACMQAAKKTATNCVALMPTDFGNQNGSSDKFDACVERNMQKGAGVSPATLDRCGQNPSEAPEMASLQEMGNMMRRHAKTSSTSGVTLPVYKNAEIMMHIRDDKNLNSMKAMLGVKPLPGITLASAASVATVSAYYRGKLKGFKEYKVEGGVLFMEKGPKQFDMVRDIKLYSTTPHVMVDSINNNPLAPPGSKSKIEIGYRR